MNPLKYNSWKKLDFFALFRIRTASSLVRGLVAVMVPTSALSIPALVELDLTCIVPGSDEYAVARGIQHLSKGLGRNIQDAREIMPLVQEQFNKVLMEKDLFKLENQDFLMTANSSGLRVIPLEKGSSFMQAYIQHAPSTFLGVRNGKGIEIVDAAFFTNPLGNLSFDDVLNPRLTISSFTKNAAQVEIQAAHPQGINQGNLYAFVFPKNSEGRLEILDIIDLKDRPLFPEDDFRNKISSLKNDLLGNGTTPSGQKVARDDRIGFFIRRPSGDIVYSDLIRVEAFGDSYIANREANKLHILLHPPKNSKVSYILRNSLSTLAVAGISIGGSAVIIYYAFTKWIH